MRKLLLLSCSTLHGSGWLEYAREYIHEFFLKNGVKEILFVPYAGVDCQKEYTEKARAELSKWGFKITGLNETSDPIEAVSKAEGIFIGGGNTFMLLKLLQEKNLLEPIRQRVLRDGIPYMGISAGTNVATDSICTTNDMPIVHVKSFDALKLLPFNINPHYADPDPGSKHMGETREQRIKEFHLVPEKPPVLGLREGSFLHVLDETITLGGLRPARVFIQGSETEEYPVGSDLSFLFEKSVK